MRKRTDLMVRIARFQQIGEDFFQASQRHTASKLHRARCKHGNANPRDNEMMREMNGK